MPDDGQPIPVVWTLIGSPSKRAGEAEHPAFLVDAAVAGLEERLGDVGGATGIAWAQHVGGVVAGFGAQVDRHPASVES